MKPNRLVFKHNAGRKKDSQPNTWAFLSTDCPYFKLAGKRATVKLTVSLVKSAVLMRILWFYLGADLVAALAGLHVDDLAHVVVGGVCVGVAREGRGELRRCRRPDGERCSRGITD